MSWFFFPGNPRGVRFRTQNFLRKMSETKAFPGFFAAFFFCVASQR
jgi:hypothetical protein